MGQQGSKSVTVQERMASIDLQAADWAEAVRGDKAIRFGEAVIVRFCGRNDILCVRCADTKNACYQQQPLHGRSHHVELVM